MKDKKKYLMMVGVIIFTNFVFFLSNKYFNNIVYYYLPKNIIYTINLILIPLLLFQSKNLQLSKRILAYFQKINKITKVIFLVSIIFYALSQVLISLNIGSNSILLVLNKLSGYLAILTGFIGLIIFIDAEKKLLFKDDIIKKIELRKKETSGTIILFLIPIIIVGLVIRIKNLDSSLWVDEIWHTYSSMMAIQQNSFFGAFEIYKNSPIITSISYITGLLWGFKSEFALRLPIVLINTFSIFLSYLVGRELKDKKAGIFFASIVALSPIIIQTAQFIRHYNLFVLYQLIIFFFFIRYLKTKSRLSLLALCTTVIIHATTVHIYPLITLPFLIIEMIRKDRDWQIFINRNLVFFAIIIITILVWFFSKYNWILAKDQIYNDSFYYLKNIFIYEFFICLIFIAGIFTSGRKITFLYLSVISELIILSLLPLREPMYPLFIITQIYLIAGYTVSDITDRIQSKTGKVISASLFYIILLWSLAHFNLYGVADLETKINNIKNPNNLSYIGKYFSFDFASLQRNPYMIRADYRDSLIYIHKNSDKNKKVVVISESPESIRYYNALRGYNFIIIHPWYEAKSNAYETILNDHENYDIYAVIGHRIEHTKKDSVIKIVQDEINKMKIKKKYNAIMILHKE